MSNDKRPTPDQHRAQIAAYSSELENYARYAAVLKRVLEKACEQSVHEAVVQTRAKTLASFAEKCVRKWEKHKNPAEEFTDLCGGRVIVQTLDQVKMVRAFVEANFIVVETEDIGLRLGDDKFGYRDRHYIVQLHPERALRIGVEPEELRTIGTRKAELHIRTWAQHAWADTLHDRLYKSPLTHSAEAKRTASLLAAIMEEGDLNFDRLANELDGMVANYAGYADRTKVIEEAEVQQLLLDQLNATHRTAGRNDRSREKVALALARLRAALGENQNVVGILTRFARVPSPIQDEIEVELGMALCRLHRKAADSEKYHEGRDLLRGVVERFAAPETAVIVNLRHRDCVRAKACSRLAWAEEVESARIVEAGTRHRQAIEIEPENPYYLANMIGHELRPGQRADEMPGSLRPAMIAALAKCQSHAAQRLELQFSFFTAGRLRPLLGEHEAALHDYLRGAHHCLDAASCYGPEALDEEIAWLEQIRCPEPASSRFEQAKQFLELAKAMKAHVANAPGLPTARAEIKAGLGQKGFEIVKRHSRERRLPFRKRVHLSYDRLKRRLEGREVECPRRIVVIDPAPNERLMEMCEEAGVCVLVGDASMPEVLMRARVAEAAEVVVITPSDETNVRIATAIRELSLNARTHPECNVHIADIHLREALDRWIDSGDDRPKTRPHFFDVFDSEARRVLRDHPLNGAGIRTDDPTSVHVVSLGFGRMARSLALRAAKVGHFANRKKLRISVIDRNADRQRERFAFRHPALADGKICDLGFFSAEAESATTGDHLKKWAAEPAVRLHVFICLDDDTRSLEMALRMQAVLGDHKDCGLYVRVRSQHSIAPILDAAAGGQSRIVPFGAVEDTCSEESYRDGKLNVIARAIHGEFVRQRSASKDRTPQSDLALRDWEDLRDDIRESNRQQADHLRVKLRAIGCELVANDVPGEPVEVLTTSETEKLAPMELSLSRLHGQDWVCKLDQAA